MPKHRLKLYDFDQEYTLLAIHSNTEIFKIAYNLNSLLKKQIENCNVGGLGWELIDGKPRHDDQCVLVCSLK